MVKLKKLELTEALLARLAIVQAGEEHATFCELYMLKAELADEVMAEVARQEMVRTARVDRLDDQLKRKPAVVVEVSLRPKRKIRA